MKKIFIVAALMLGSSLLAQDHHRMIRLGGEDIEGDRMSVVYLHDTETGQEVVCIYGSLAAPSCYLTGRKW